MMSDTGELELKAIVSLLVGAADQTLVLIAEPSLQPHILNNILFIHLFI